MHGSRSGCILPSPLVAVCFCMVSKGIITLIAILFFTTALARPTDTNHCDKANFPDVGPHDYRLDAYDEPGCRKKKHHEYFFGTFKAAPLPFDLNHCHTLKPVLRGKVGSYIFNQGAIPLLEMRTWSGPNCSGDVLDYKLGNRVSHNTKLEGVERVQSFNVLELLKKTF
ncbi:hypothetical protein BJ138DRAFT_373502 [Hygrophoropsis aurantiaca]|uniref:Uncharacterized protein n=1 Tax=Hygrophoropsis aurantiaca TaxID=72124 RepID=A0ACB8A5K2_9AGAM|nr:hypothetical protein BJ138DRAFT_373502 [Hygrophoropsis aurantiaca]